MKFFGRPPGGTIGKQSSTRGFHGKYAGLFIATATQVSREEVVATAAMSTLAHPCMIYVPLGYKTAFAIPPRSTEIRGLVLLGCRTVHCWYPTIMYMLVE
jgi:hypothetical protein